ncbi:GAF domain-containing SpoIIE family protein phosphatase [Peijinzhouia sedimentorum]
MLSQKAILRITGPLAFLSWLILLAVNLIIYFGEINQVPSGIPGFIPPALLSIFFLSLLIFFRHQIDKAKRMNLVDMLWKVFVTGLMAAIITILVILVFVLLGDNRLSQNPLFINFLYHLDLGVITVFLVITFTIYKRLVLYQKSKVLINTWYIFEYGLMISIMLNFFKIELFDSFYITTFIFFLVLSLYLSVNLKWVAYLSFKEKWKSILLLLLVCLYLYFFLTVLSGFPSEILVVNLVDNVFATTLFSFIFIYSLFSFLVILFNLPTTSVFEQKLKEAVNIQMLSRTIQEKRNESEIYQMFFFSSVSAVFADAAFLESVDEKGTNRIILKENLTDEQIEEIKDSLASSKVRPLKSAQVPVEQSGIIAKALKYSGFRSLMMLPLVVKEKEIAQLYLLKEVSDGFNDEMQNIITTFANQASISIENSRLMTETVANERYQKELKIAKEVQKALLPTVLEKDPAFEISAFSQAADEVGGDYYDIFKKSDVNYALIIADVSGKGTSAAFHMSQLKGIFQSLSEIALGPKEFLIHANSALSRCLDRRSFITASYFLIDTSDSSIKFARAGHCPTLYFKKSDNKAYYFKNKGLGLGVLRNNQFQNYIQVHQMNYESGDIMVLYTDGITESKNDSGEELGYEALKKWLEENAHFDAETIKNRIAETFLNFCGEAPPDDDYTVVVIKFE